MLKQFTCTQSLYSIDTNWLELWVNSDDIDFSYGSYGKKLTAYGKTTTGYRMTDNFDVYEEPYDYDDHSCYTKEDVHSYESYNHMKLVIMNPYNGPLMTSDGHFCGLTT